MLSLKPFAFLIRNTSPRMRRMLAGSIILALAKLLGYARDAVVAARFGADGPVAAYIATIGLLGITGTVAADAVMIWSSQHFMRGGGSRKPWRIAIALSAMTAVAVSSSSELIAGLLVRSNPSLEAEVAQAIRAMSVGFGGLIALAVAQGKFNAEGRLASSFGLSVAWSAIALGGAAFLSPPRLAIYASWSIAIIVVAAYSLLLVSASPNPDGDGAVPLAWIVLIAAASLANQLSFVLERRYGSSLGDAAVTALGLGYKITSLPLSLIVGTLGAAAISKFRPDMTYPDLRRRFAQLACVSAGAVAVILAVIAIAAPGVVAVAFGRGEFSKDAQSLTVNAVRGFVPAVVGASWYVIAARANQAIGRLTTSVAAAIAGFAVTYITLRAGAGTSVTGIALATGAGNIIAAVLATAPWMGSTDASGTPW